MYLLQNSFYYSLVYDPQQKTLLADKGEIRVGSSYQCPITPLLKEGMAIDALNNICYFILKVIWHILRMLVKHKFYKLQHGGRSECCAEIINSFYHQLDKIKQN